MLCLECQFGPKASSRSLESIVKMVTPQKVENGSVLRKATFNNEEWKKSTDLEESNDNDYYEDGSESEERKLRPNDDQQFLVNYQGRTYDIKPFFQFHPGGKSTLKTYKGHSLDNVLSKNPHSAAAYHLFEEFALDNQSKYDNLEKLVNWDAPILWQVSSLKDRYWEWVNLPVHRHIRLFHSNILEYLSVTPWYLIPIVWLPASFYFFFAGCFNSVHGPIVNSLPEILFSFAFGVLLWSIMEYYLHRKVFHFEPPHNSRVLITLHFLIHGVHHKAPFDGQRLLFPPAVGVLVAIIFWKLYNLIFPEFMVYFIAAGTIAGYLCYDLMHYYLHYGAPKYGSYLYDMKRNHNYHHFSQHDQGFGISSNLWDYVFGTRVNLRDLVKPIEW